MAATSVRKMVPFFKRKNLRVALDYGAGTLRNSIYLQQQGFKVYAVDTPQQIAKVKEKAAGFTVHQMIDTDEVEKLSLGVDLIICNFVLTIVESPAERERIIRNTYANLAPEGYFLVEVREKKAPEGKGFTPEELDQLVMPQGFRKIIGASRKNSLVALYQKIPCQGFISSPSNDNDYQRKTGYGMVS